MSLATLALQSAIRHGSHHVEAAVVGVWKIVDNWCNRGSCDRHGSYDFWGTIFLRTNSLKKKLNHEYENLEKHKQGKLKYEHDKFNKKAIKSVKLQKNIKKNKSKNKEKKKNEGKKRNARKNLNQ